MKKLFTSKWIKPVALSVLASILVFSAVAFVPASVLAQSGSETSNTPSQAGANANGITKLENAYAREQAWLTIQENNLEKMSNLVVIAQKWIDKAKAKGWKVDVLEDALNVFNSQIPNAQALHDSAAKILSAHDGFDGNGNVTNADQAFVTVRDTRQSLRNAHNIISQAVFDLRTAIRNFRNAHHKAADQSGSPAPTSSTSGG